MRNLGLALVLAFTAAVLSAADAPKGSGSVTPPSQGSGSVSDPGFVTTNILIGQLNNLNVEARTFTLNVKTQTPVPNQNAQNDLARAQQDLQRAQQDYNNAQTIRDPKQRAQKINDAQNRANDATNRINTAKGNLVKVEEKSQDVQMQMTDDMVVRTLNLPVFFDDKGNPRKPTDDELKELMQPPGFPGYKAALSDLANGQNVEVFIGHKKGETAQPKPPQGSGSGSGSTPQPPPQPVICVLIGKSSK
jgi:hypothetical protein